MDKVRIYPILDYILNQADTDDLAAIREALKRREKQSGFGGMDIQTMARETGKGIESQIGGSIESIRNMVRGFAVDMIRKEVPDIPEEHLNSLIEAWIPDQEKRRGKQPTGSDTDLPKDALLTMIRQYIAFKTNTMRPEELRSLVSEMNDWPEVYWNRLPAQIRRIIAKYLNGEIKADMCWELIERTL